MKAGQLHLFTPAFKQDDRVRYTEKNGQQRRTRVYGPADPEIYGPDRVHVYSHWLSILFVTVPAAQLETLP